MSCLHINGAAYPYEQLCISIPRLDLPSWLSKQHIYPKVYWQDRDSSAEHAALGDILCFHSAPDFASLPDCDVRFYGGMHFDGSKRETLWQGFPDCAFWLPAFEVIQTEQSTQLLMHFIHKKASKESMRDLCMEDDENLPFKSMDLLQEQESISFDKWKEHIDHALSLMNEGHLQKVVLARKRELLFAHPPSVWEMVKRVKSHAEGATVFAFSLKENLAFFGASPERFFHRKRDLLSMDALAGTRKRGNTALEESVCERELCLHPKERREFASVKHFIEDTMRSFAQKCEWLEIDAILKTAHVQHLYNRADFQLKEPIADRHLIDALHPTPALGGFPKKSALQLILELETFQRGWYGSPVGWIGPNETNLIVAIRCGLLKDAALHLFAGAGIVAESLAEMEWEEINQKMRLILYGCGIA